MHVEALLCILLCLGLYLTVLCVGVSPAGVPLYDWSAVRFDDQTMKLLHQHLTMLNRLTTLLSIFAEQPSTDIGESSYLSVDFDFRF